MFDMQFFLITFLHSSVLQVFIGGGGLVTKWCLTHIEVAHQAPLSMGFPKQEHLSGLPFPSPGNLPHSGIGPVSPSFQVDSLPLSHQGSHRY